jgi:hypothetical protein
MTKLRLLALLAVVALVLFPAIAFAQGGLQPPCAFHGTALVNGQNVADGTVITATIGNDTYTATTTTAAGASTYRIVIAQPEGKSYDGLTVTFMIGSATAGQTGTWQMGGNVAINLTKGTPQVTPGGGTLITGVQLGNSTGYDSVTGIITIDKSAITGAKGDTGATGAVGAQGPAGKSASSVLGLVAIIIAVIALAIGVIVMMRKPQPQKP